MPKTLYLILVCTAFASLLGICGSMAEEPPGFTLHARIHGISSCLGSIIGPGPEPGTERLYATHGYSGSLLDVVAVDPLTGETDVFSNHLISEMGAWSIALGPDGNVYVGTHPNAHILKLDWSTRKLVDMGRPSTTEQYIWQLVVGSDKKLYGCTYPNAKLIRFDPLTGKGEDLGRMSETEYYARHIAADEKGFVYLGIGTSKRDLVAFEIASGKRQSILPADLAGHGFVRVLRGTDGKVYASAAGKWLTVEGFSAVPAPPQASMHLPQLSLADGRVISYDGLNLTTKNPDGTTLIRPTGYRGKDMRIFRLGLGPDGFLYGSTMMPIRFFKANPENDHWEEIAEAGKGEIYSFLRWQNKLVFATYSGLAPIMIYSPNQPWNPGKSQENNPWLLHYEGENISWRPMAILAGPDNKIYIGAISPYGLLGGPLCVLDPFSGKLDCYAHVVQDHSVAALTVTHDGLIVGGTTVNGGGGSHRSRNEAKLFLWDPVNRETTFEMVPVRHNNSISALAVAQNGLVYGFAANNTIFVFNPQTKKLIHSTIHQLSAILNNSVATAPNGKMYGLYSGGIFTVDESLHSIQCLAQYTLPITAGFALHNNQIYFASGSRIISYTLNQ